MERLDDRVMSLKLLTMGKSLVLLSPWEYFNVSCSCYVKGKEACLSKGCVTFLNEAPLNSTSLSLLLYLLFSL